MIPHHLSSSRGMRFKGENDVCMGLLIDQETSATGMVDHAALVTGLEEALVTNMHAGMLKHTPPWVLLTILYMTSHMELKMLIWNTQGAGSRKFLRTLKEHVRMQRPQIMALLETHVNGHRADDVCRKIGFRHHFHVQARGFCGGIWLLWTGEETHLRVLEAHDQFVTTEISVRGTRTWQFTAIYASPHATLREELWTKLEHHANSSRAPWLLAGDFNETRSLEERDHGGPDMARRCSKFSNWIENNALHDLGFSGPKFTWVWGINQTTRKCARVDPALCNTEWRTMIATCDELDRKVRRFLWAGTNTERKLYLVAWDIITRPIEEGGLGIRAMRELNSASMTKLRWRLIHDPETLWARVLRHKYCKGRVGTLHMEPGRYPSNAWKGVCEMRSILQRGMAHAIGNGQHTLFWTQRWATNRPLSEVATEPVPLEEIEKPVAYYWHPGMGWRWEAFGHRMPREIRDQIAAFQVYPEAKIEDTLFWGETNSGVFSIKSAIQVIRKDLPVEHHGVWSRIW
ncbi:hypothetical protein Cgig2_022842 [Carnegiea gigantea]|uniref:Endonuclease/exonuclease/phosphatase domain-containing protein n=1 Tax=Carnegiea gigantea TaxID=171969 RepID=A0A9Q1KPC5_9CARY|nr:hypothetical protein Cgig2_022842 [Carnegiea gigantea]